MTTKRIRKLATVAATAALAVQMFAGTASAAVPNATSVGDSYDFAGNGDAGFWTEFHFQDNNLPKLYLKIKIENGASLSSLTITKEGNVLSNKSSCSTATGAVIECLFKTIKNGDDFRVEFAVTPLAPGNVTATGGWSSTGYVLGDNNSHGDSWDIADSETDDNTLVATYNDDPDLSAGFGGADLFTKTNFGANQQYAKLTGLPAGRWASVDDNVESDGVGFSVINLTVNDGEAANFQLQITYPKTTSAPKSYLHISSATDEYFVCARGQTVNCFTWDKKTYTATLYLAHNGSLRRTS